MTYTAWALLSVLFVIFNVVMGLHHVTQPTGTPALGIMNIIVAVILTLTLLQSTRRF
jgi:hypothetical protein